MPPQVGDPAPDLSLPDTSGRARRLSEFWNAHPALVLFLRHFGCTCLAERWELLRDELPAYEAAGATVVAISQGEPERTAAVARRRGYLFPILCYPERVAYQRYGILEGAPAQVLHDFPWRPGDQATAQDWLMKRRPTERALVDNPWQLPADFVIGTSGRVAHAHRAQYCEDSRRRLCSSARSSLRLRSRAPRRRLPAGWQRTSESNVCAPCRCSALARRRS